MHAGSNWVNHSKSYKQDNSRLAEHLAAVSLVDMFAGQAQVQHDEHMRSEISGIGKFSLKTP